MIIMVRLDYEGDDLQNDLEKMIEINSKIESRIGGKIEGPFFPQQSTRSSYSTWTSMSDLTRLEEYSTLKCQN